MERGDWAGAAVVPPRLTKFPQVMAITCFARALGAARGGHPEATTADIAKLTELRDTLADAKEVYSLR